MRKQEKKLIIYEKEKKLWTRTQHTYIQKDKWAKEKKLNETIEKM